MDNHNRLGTFCSPNLMRTTPVRTVVNGQISSNLINNDNESAQQKQMTDLNQLLMEHNKQLMAEHQKMVELQRQADQQRSEQIDKFIRDHWIDEIRDFGRTVEREIQRIEKIPKERITFEITEINATIAKLIKLGEKTEKVTMENEKKSDERHRQLLRALEECEKRQEKHHREMMAFFMSQNHSNPPVFWPENLSSTPNPPPLPPIKSELSHIVPVTTLGTPKSFNFSFLSSKVEPIQKTTPKAILSDNDAVSKINLFSDNLSKTVGKIESPSQKLDSSGRNRESSETSDANVENYIPDAHFEPVIPLPNLVVVNTGEEGEQVLFNGRVKLFRYDGKEWKERGIGDLKILYNDDSRCTRLVMRRDQVHKVCANHRLCAPMKLTPMQNSEKAWTWRCQDFSDGQLDEQTLAAKFKNVEIAHKFKVEFEKAVEVVGQQAETQRQGDIFTKSTEKDKKIFGAEFLPKPSSWQCTGCYVNNGPELNQCQCCGTNKDGTTSTTVELTKMTIPMAQSGFTFGVPQEITEKSKTIPEKTVENKNKSVEKVPNGKANAGEMAWKFGSTPESKLSGTKIDEKQRGSVENKGRSIFGSKMSTDAISFSSLAQSIPKDGQIFKATGSGFPGGPSKLFANLASPEPAAKSEGNTSINEHEEYEPNVHFEPVVPLPNLVVTTTGEEGEKSLFNERAKLFRFDGKEWKERGVGVLKILYNDDSRCTRLVMRRDQVHKVCANHRLCAPMKLTPMQNSEKAWTWRCQDFSDGQLDEQTLAAKFKNVEIAHKFKVEFEKAVEVVGQQAETQRQGDIFAKSTEKSEQDKSAAFGFSFKIDASTEHHHDDHGDDYDEEVPIWEGKAVLTKNKADASPLKPKGSAVGNALNSINCHPDIDGHLQVSVSNGVNLYQVVFEDNQRTPHLNHQIVMDDQIRIDDHLGWTAEWTAFDVFASDLDGRTVFRISFVDENSRNEFVECFKTGVKIAIKSNISSSFVEENDNENLHQDRRQLAMLKGVKESMRVLNF